MKRSTSTSRFNFFPGYPVVHTVQSSQLVGNGHVVGETLPVPALLSLFKCACCPWISKVVGKVSQKYPWSSCIVSRAVPFCPVFSRDSHEPATRAARVQMALDGASRPSLRAPDTQYQYSVAWWSQYGSCLLINRQTDREAQQKCRTVTKICGLRSWLGASHYNSWQVG